MLKRNKKILLTFLTLSLSIVPLFETSAMKKKQPSYLPLIPEENKEEIDNNIEITCKTLTKYYDIIKKNFDVEDYKKNITTINNLICLDENFELNTKKFIENLKANNLIDQNPYINYYINEENKQNLTNFLKEIKMLLTKKIGIKTQQPPLNSNLNHKSNRNLNLKLHSNSKSNLKLNLSLSRNSSRNNLNIKTLKNSQKKIPKLAPKSFAKTISTPNLFNKTLKNNFKNNVKNIKNSITIEITKDTLRTYKKYIRNIKTKFEKAIDSNAKQGLLEKIENFICLNQNDEIDIRKFLENIKSIEKLNNLNLPDYDEYAEYNLKINEKEKDGFIKSLKNTRDFINQNSNCDDLIEINNKKRIPISINQITKDYVDYINKLCEKCKKDIEKIKEIDINKIDYKKDIDPVMKTCEKLIKLPTLRGEDLIEQLIRCRILIRLKNKNEEYYIPNNNIKKINDTLKNLISYINEIVSELNIVSCEKIAEHEKLNLQKEINNIIKNITSKKNNFKENLNKRLNNKNDLSSKEIEQIKNDLDYNKNYLDAKTADYIKKIGIKMAEEHSKIMSAKNKIEIQEITNKNDIIAKSYSQEIIKTFENISEIILKDGFKQNIINNINNSKQDPKQEIIEEKNIVDEISLDQLETIIKNMLTNIIALKNSKTKTNMNIVRQNLIFDELFQKIIDNVECLYKFKQNNLSLEMFLSYQEQIQRVGAAMILNIQNYKNLMKLKNLTKDLKNFYVKKINIINNLTPATTSQEDTKTIHEKKKKNKK